MGLWLEMRFQDDETGRGHLLFRGRFRNGMVEFERAPNAPEIFATPPPMDREEAIRLARRSAHMQLQHRQYALRCTSSEEDLELAGVTGSE